MSVSNQTYDIPVGLSDLQGAYDTAHWETVVAELKPDAGVLARGSVLALVSGKLELVRPRIRPPSTAFCWTRASTPPRSLATTR
jgi:hypothetical protein